MRMNFATKASRWKITFYIGTHTSESIPQSKYTPMTYTAKFDAMLIKSGPLDHVRLERIVDLCDKLEGQGLWHDVRYLDQDLVGHRSIPSEWLLEECNASKDRTDGSELAVVEPVIAPPGFRRRSPG